jgi:hypothetical protein
VVDPMRDRLADDDVHPRHQREIATEVGEEVGLPSPRGQLERYVEFRRLDALRVLVEFRAAGPAGDPGHFGVGQEHSLDHSSQFVRLPQRGSGQGNGADRQRPFVELGEEHTTEEWDGRPSREEQGQGRDDHGPRLPQRRAQQPAVHVFEHADDPGLLALRDRAAPGQQQRAEGRRQREADDQRGGQRDHVGHAPGAKQSALDARQEKDRQEHQQDDDRGEDDRRPHLGARVVDDCDWVLATVRRKPGILPESADHVLDVNDRVVDQVADGDGHAAQRHRVDRCAERL